MTRIGRNPRMVSGWSLSPTIYHAESARQTTRTLLILDLDETILFSNEKRLDREPEFLLGLDGSEVGLAKAHKLAESKSVAIKFDESLRGTRLYGSSRMRSLRN